MVAGGEASPRAQPPVGAAAETAGERVVQTRLAQSTAEGLDSAAAGEFSLTFAPVGETATGVRWTIASCPYALGPAKRHGASNSPAAFVGDDYPGLAAD